MKLIWKFNLVLLGIFALGFLVAGYVSYKALQANAREEVLQHARIMMEAALATRTYTAAQVKPLLDTQMQYKFLPQTVPAYAATEQFNELRKKHPDYSYKEATLNPTNPRDRATDWEADIVQQFRHNAESKELVSERSGGTGRILYIAKPIQITNAACLQCHTTAAMAPPTMVKIYGEANGFGWKHNEIVGAQVVSVPMDIPIRNADRTFTTFMASLAGVFAVVFVVLNVMLSWLIVRPIRQMSQAADKVSTGDFEVPEFREGGRDEVAILGSSFNRMRRSLEKAMQMIGDQ
ncbi:MAG: DUF3365 domain-containing protein [Casimicrobiaceae bacterium]